MIDHFLYHLADIKILITLIATASLLGHILYKGFIRDTQKEYRETKQA